jgi:colicin import membrane protein
VNASNTLRRPKPPQVYAPAERSEDDFTRYVGISIAFHLFLLACLTVRAVLYPTEPMILDRAIRVDIVGLPDKVKTLPPEIKEALKETPPAPKPVEEAKPEAKKEVLPDKPKAVPIENKKVNLDKAKQKQDSSLKRLEALQRIESQMKESKAKAQANAKPQPVRGNEVSPGSALTGIAKIENDNYLVDAGDHVKKYWDLPNFLENSNLKASVIVYINESAMSPAS